MPLDCAAEFGSDEVEEAAEGVGEGWWWWLFVATVLFLTGF